MPLVVRVERNEMEGQRDPQHDEQREPSSTAHVFAYHLRWLRRTIIAFQTPMAAAPMNTTADSSCRVSNQRSSVWSGSESPIITVSVTPQATNVATTAVDAMRILRCACASSPVSG